MRRFQARFLSAGGFLLCWHHHGDLGALADRAFDLELAAVQLDQGLHDRQAEAGAFLAAGEGVVDLAEGARARCRSARAGCRCRCRRPRARPMPPAPVGWAESVTWPPCGVNLMALLSRLIRICLTARLSAIRRGVGGDRSGAPPAGRHSRALAHQPGAILERLLDLDRLEMQLEAAGLDLREVEDVVDDGEQVLAAASGCRGIVGVLRAGRWRRTSASA